MKRYVIIARGYKARWPYEVGVDRDGGKRPILLAEGSGHGTMGGTFALQELLDEKWTDHLIICGCLWLRELAREEAARGDLFTAAEILGRQLMHDEEV